MIVRQKKIIELIKNERIYKQSELVEKLKKLGIEATQATVSRDIKALNINKSYEDGKGYYTVNETDDALPENYLRVLKEGYLHSELAMNLLVIKTVSGLAMAVAAAIDAAHFSELIGCIAGDDTIFLAASDILAAKHLKKKIEALL